MIGEGKKEREGAHRFKHTSNVCETKKTLNLRFVFLLNKQVASVTGHIY